MKSKHFWMILKGQENIPDILQNHCESCKNMSVFFQLKVMWEKLLRTLKLLEVTVQIIKTKFWKFKGTYQFCLYLSEGPQGKFILQLFLGFDYGISPALIPKSIRLIYLSTIIALTIHQKILQYLKKSFGRSEWCTIAIHITLS